MTFPYPVTNPQPQTDSYAPLVRDLMIKMPSETVFLRLPTYNCYRGLTLEVGAGAAHGTLELFFDSTASTDVLRQEDPEFEDSQGRTLASMADAMYMPVNTLFKTRWHWDRDGNYPARAITYTLSVTKVLPTFTPNGVGLTLEVTQAVLDTDGVPTIALQAMILNKDDNTMPRKWAAGKKASEIVAEIATYMKWVAPVIETSEGTLDEMAIPADQTYMTFIRDTLLPRTVNSRKERYVFYFDTSNVLHFHSARNASPGVLRRAYRMFRDQKGEVISFDPADATLFTSLAGSQSVMESFDSTTGTATHRVADASTGVDGAGVGRTVTGEEGYIPKVESQKADGTRVAKPTAVVPVRGRNDAESASLASTIHAALREVNYEATLVVRGTHKVHVLDFIQFEYYQSAVTTVQPHYMSGIFQVLGMTHNVDEGGWTTTFKVFRQAFPIAALSSASTGDTNTLTGTAQSVTGTAIESDD
jgi:hypothetical protein